MFYAHNHYIHAYDLLNKILPRLLFLQILDLLAMIGLVVNLLLCLLRYYPKIAKHKCTALHALLAITLTNNLRASARKQLQFLTDR